MTWVLTIGVIATGLLSTLLVYLGMGYAERRGLLDAPGQRRSHQVATPRGGGIGIVIAALLGVGLPLLIVSDADGLIAASVGGMLLVALVGWVDDHNGLPARIRFTAHLLASLALALALLWPVLAMFSWLPSLLMLGVIVFSTAWSINLHNFMDGINGLLACQAIFVLLVVAILAAVGADSGLAWASLGTAAAVAGFLPWNFPRARVFMGDVGSGA
ncbi:MAG: glycosyl transferase family 4, partial [Dokdonella sp.]